MVVFPAPLGPRKPVTRPGWTTKLIVYGERSVVAALDQPIDDDRRDLMADGA